MCIVYLCVPVCVLQRAEEVQARPPRLERHTVSNFQNLMKEKLAFNLIPGLSELAPPEVIHGFSGTRCVSGTR